MAITLKPETEKLIESRMKRFGFTDADELLVNALQLLDDDRGVPYEELDEETRAAIEDADAQEGIPWEQVRDQLLQRYGGK